MRYYSRFRAAGDKKGCAKLNGMFLTTYLFLGALVLVCIGIWLVNKAPAKKERAL